MLKFVFNGKTKSKERPRMNRYTGAVYTPKSTYDFEYELKKQFKIQHKDHIPSEKRLKVTIRFYFEIKESKKGKVYWKKYGNYYIGNKDLDNMAKAVLDSLNKVAYKDDRQIVQLAVAKYYGETDKIEFEMEEIEND